MRLWHLLLAAFVLGPTTLQAEDPGGPIEIAFEPRSIDAAAFQSRLLPAEADIQKGDAAPILLRLPWEQRAWMNEAFDKMQNWETVPLDSPTWKDASNVLPANFYREMKRAAYRRTASWEYPIGEDHQPFYLILLPDVQGLRHFLGHGLTAKARYHISRGELAEAQETILVGLANSRHLAQTPFLVNQLVASAIQKSMLARVDELIAQPGAPNLYWALTTLPDSMLELDRTASVEGSGFALTFPAAKELNRPRDAEEWRRMAEQLVDVLTELNFISAAPPEPESTIGKIINAVAPATGIHRTSFVTHGRRELPTMLDVSEDVVAKMSDNEVGVRWYSMRRMALDHKIEAVMSLSPREAWKQAVQLRDELEKFREQSGSQDQFFHPVGACVSMHSVNRKIQALRVVEAVRDFAGKHEGRFPEKLAEIQDVPVPHDPFTDLPFVWSVNEGVATLSCPELPIKMSSDGQMEKNASFTYRLTVRK